MIVAILRLMLRIARYIILAFLTVAPTAAQDFRPPELNVQFHRAHTAWATGNSLLEAKARIDRVLAVVPDDIEALKLRAAILMDLERPEEALRDASHAARNAPEDGEAHLLRCESAVLIDRNVVAKEALETASDLFLGRTSQYVRLSNCALRLEAMTRAESLARVAVAQDASDPRGYVQLARIFAATGRSDDALALLNRMIDSGVLSRSAVMADSQLAALFR